MGEREPYGWRDRIAAAACNWIMRHIATERYRKMIGGSVSYGLASALRDDLDGRDAPPPLWAAAAQAYAEGRLRPLPRKPQVRPESDYEAHLLSAPDPDG